MSFSKSYDKFSLRKYVKVILNDAKKVYNKTNSENLWEVYEFWKSNHKEAMKLNNDKPVEKT